MPEKAKKGLFRNLWSVGITSATAGLQDLAGLWGYVSKPDLRKKILGDIWSFLKELFLKIKNERIPREAAGLTYTTILGFVPFILFLVLIVPDLPFLNIQDKIYMTIANNFMPTSALAVNNLIEGMLAKRAGFNIANFIVLIATSYSLFRLIRNTFDRILSLDYAVKQDLISHLVKFFGTIIVGVLIMVVMFSSTSLPLVSSLLNLPLLRWLTYLIPFLMQFVALVFLYTLMPSIKVRRSSLIRGAFWTTMAWVLVKSVFDVYIYQLTSYQAVYGVLAAVPIFLLWIYVNWLIILGGIVLVAVIDVRKNPERLAAEPKRLLRLTLEMYSNQKLNQKLERFITREELKELSETLDDEDPE